MLYAGSKGRCGPMTPGRGLAGLCEQFQSCWGRCLALSWGPRPTLAREPIWVFPCKEGPRSPSRVWAADVDRPGLFLHNLCFLAQGSGAGFGD